MTADETQRSPSKHRIPEDAEQKNKAPESQDLTSRGLLCAQSPVSQQRVKIVPHPSEFKNINKPAQELHRNKLSLITVKLLTPRNQEKTLEAASGRERTHTEP